MSTTPPKSRRDGSAGRPISPPQKKVAAGDAKSKPPSGKLPATKSTKSIPPRRGRGRKPFEPTLEQRKHVETLAGLGLRQDEIVLLIENPTTGRPIDEKTLRRHFQQELASGPSRLNMQVAQALARRAMGKGAGAVTAAIFWLKCRAGWKESIRIEAEVKSGVLVVPSSASVDQWLERFATRSATAVEPGSEDGES